MAKKEKQHRKKPKPSIMVLGALAVGLLEAGQAAMNGQLVLAGRKAAMTFTGWNPADGSFDIRRARGLAALIAAVALKKFVVSPLNINQHLRGLPINL